MTHRQVIKVKTGEKTFENWISAQLTNLEEGGHVTEELLKANPDLAKYEPVEQSDELRVALDVLNEGGLTHLTALQQRIFQLSVVEGGSNREVGRLLSIDESTVREHLSAIGKTLRALCAKKL